MTRVEHEIRRRILRKLRVRIQNEREAVARAYLLGLEAGELMKGNRAADRTELGRNFAEAKELGVRMDLQSENERKNHES